MKTTLVQGTQGILQKDFRETNSLIADFNREAETYNTEAVSAGFESMPTIAPITTTIKFQEPTFVDVRPIPDTTPKVKLTGKTYSGTVGGAKAKIEFNDGAFAVSGDIEGQGQWRQSGSGVGLETKSSVYRGVVSGNGIKGYRYFKDHRPYERFEIKLKEKLDVTSIVGKWKRKRDTNITNDYTFNADGSGTMVTRNHTSGFVQSDEIEWKVIGDKVDVRRAGHPESNDWGQYFFQLERDYNRE